ncbi:MAG: hypothetical protein IJP70_10250 [Bacteroidales bacterium]|nr:hypothetical protein [Bacteroidales bacterium]
MKPLFDTHLVLTSVIALTLAGCTVEESDYYSYGPHGTGSHTLIDTAYDATYEMSADIYIYYFINDEEHPHRNNYWTPGTILANSHRFDFYNFPIDEVLHYLPDMRYSSMSSTLNGSGSTSLCVYGFTYTRDELPTNWGSTFLGGEDSIVWHIPAHTWSFMVADSIQHTVDVCFRATDDYIRYEVKGSWTYRASLRADSILLDGAPIPEVSPERPYLIHFEAQAERQYN